MRLARAVLCLALIVLPSPDGARADGPARPVADLNPAVVRGSTLGDQDALTVDGFTWFKAVADLPARRGQLWRTDGTPAGTLLLHEFSGVDATGMAEVDGVLLFGGRTWDLGAELWRSDGTPAGTTLVADLAPGSASSAPQRFVRLGGAVYFVTSEEPARGLGRLYRTDGTAAGTNCVYPCGEPPAVPAASALVVMDGALYFTAVFSTVVGPSSELRRSDGTPEGTVLVHPFTLGPVGLAAVAGRLFFSADDGLHGLEPWTSDGSTDGTSLTQDIRPGRFGSMDLSVRLPLGARLLFSANDGVRGLEPWITDGTAAGTHLLKDLNPGPAGGFPHHLTASGESAYFVAGTGPNGRDLWRTDGSDSGTVRVHTITPDLPGLLDVAPMAVAAGRVHFAGWDASHGWELWSSDGTSGGTSLVADVRPGAEGSLEPMATPRLASAGGRLLLFADDGTHGREPWISDGTASGTILLRDANPVSGTAGAGPRALAAAGPTLFFLTEAPEAIWATEGAPRSTRRLTSEGAFAAAECLDQAAGDRLYAVACPPELWASDGTPQGTGPVAGAIVSDPGDDIALPFPVGSSLLFVADGEAARLAITDGTREGTRVLKELASIGTEPPAAVGPRMLLNASDGGSGREPWISDGTPEGTLQIMDVRPGTAGSAPSSFAPMGDRALFRAHDGTHGPELWITDGTPERTRLVRDLEPGADGSSFVLSPRASSGSEAWLVASRGVESRMWKTDGTDAGTVPVGPVFVGGTNRPHELTRAGERIFFASGTDLWISDGTDAGTHSLRKFDRAPRSLLAVDGSLLFAAGAGRPPFLPRDTLWRSDGTDGGTLEMQDVTPVAWQFNADSEIAFVRAARRVFFVGDDGVLGEEIWGAWASVLIGDRAAALRDLAALVEAAGLPQGAARALRATLALADRAAGLQPFLRQVEALRGRALTEEAASGLRQLAEDIGAIAQPAP